MTKPQCFPATQEKLAPKDAFLIDNGAYLYLYLGSQVQDSFIQNVFGYHNLSDLKFNGVTTFAPLEGSQPSMLLSQFIEQLRSEKFGGAYAPLRLVIEGQDAVS